MIFYCHWIGTIESVTADKPKFHIKVPRRTPQKENKKRALFELNQADHQHMKSISHLESYKVMKHNSNTTTTKHF